MRQLLATAAATTAVFLAAGAWSPAQGWLAGVLSAAQLLPLLARRRAPDWSLVVVTAATAAHLLVSEPRNTMYLPVLVALTGTRNRRLCGLTLAAVGLAVLPAKGPVAGTLLAVAAGGTAWLVGAEWRRQLAERSERAARRLHDALAQSTAVMLVQAETLRAVGELTDADRARVDTLLTTGRGALTLVRQTLRTLHEDDVPPPELTEVLAGLRAAGLVLDRDPDLTGVPPALRRLAERIVAETATNALRHNGPGVRLWLTAELGEDLVLTARNATAVVPGGTGYGLASLASQVRAAGGALEFGPADGEWVVTATLPRAAARPSRTGSRAA